jgi:hypothetical protein
MTPRQARIYDAYFEIEILLRHAPIIKRLPGHAEKLQLYADGMVEVEIAVDPISAQQSPRFYAALAELNDVLREQIDPWLLAELGPRGRHAWKRYQEWRARTDRPWGDESNRVHLRSRKPKPPPGEIIAFDPNIVPDPPLRPASHRPQVLSPPSSDL